MLIGVLSDTHGRADATKVAVELLVQHGAELLIHCGDVGSRQVLDALAGIPSSFVFGNTDADTHSLRRYGDMIGVKCYGALGRIVAGEKVISFLHGDDSRQMAAILEAQECDFLFHGHTHIADVHDVGRIRVVNPGALQRASAKTVALVNTQTGDVNFLEVK